MLFILAFFLVYLGMHIFTWSRLAYQLSLPARAVLTGYLACVLLAISPVAAHLMPAAWPEPLVYFFWQITFTWLGMIFYLFLLQLAFFILELIIRPAAGRLSPKTLFRAAWAIIITSFLVVGYGFMEASRPLQVTEYELSSPKLDRDLRVVFVADIHLGVQKSLQRVTNLRDRIQEQNPDLIVFGGDIVNDHLEWMQDEAGILRELEAELGSYGVLGNHEFYAGIEGSRDFFANAGIRLLEDEKKHISESNITLIGISDPAPFRAFKRHQKETVRRLTRDLEHDRYNLLVSHRPWGFDLAAESGVDLHLAGHTHKGQIFPFRFFVRLKYDHIYGLLTRNNAHFIVTSGASSWGPPIRVLAPAEIVLVKIQAG